MDEQKTKRKIEILAERMDQEAESANWHDFVGVHRLLAVIAHQALGAEATLKLFQAIYKTTVQRGGQYPPMGLQLVNYFKKMEPYEMETNTFIIPRPWTDWSLDQVQEHRHE